MPFRFSLMFLNRLCFLRLFVLVLRAGHKEDFQEVCEGRNTHNNLQPGVLCRNQLLLRNRMLPDFLLLAHDLRSSPRVTQQR